MKEGPYYHHFAVVGRRTFPIDMLRFDCCFPADTQSAQNLLFDPDGSTEPRVVYLVHVDERKLWKPSDRWSSFLGWSVVAHHADGAAVRDSVRALWGEAIAG